MSAISKLFHDSTELRNGVMTALVVEKEDCEGLSQLKGVYVFSFFHCHALLNTLRSPEYCCISFRRSSWVVVIVIVVAIVANFRLPRQRQRSH